MTASAGARTLDARTARSRRTRATLVAAVRDELRRRGAITAESVAESAGCSPATYYSHFASKLDAMTAAFEQTLDDLVDGALAEMTVAAFVDRGVEATVAAVIEQQARFYQVESLVFRASLSALPEHRPLREAYRAAERRTLDRLGAVLSELQHRGLVAPGDTQLLAEVLLVTLQGINNPRITRAAGADVRAELARGLAATLTGRRGDP